jgi:Replication-relaxation
MTTLAWRDVRPGRWVGRLGGRWPGHPERPGQLPGWARTDAQASGELACGADPGLMTDVIRLLRAGGGRGARTSAAASDQAILAAAAHLTARDRHLVRAVAEHRVLTTGQLAALRFGSVITARHRLAMLVQIGALRRFRPHREVGSAQWHYLLGPVGAALLGAEDLDEDKWLAAVRADRQLALERSQRLSHTVGVNWFFAALAAHARQTGNDARLRVWLNETATTEWLLARVPTSYRAYDMPHPDGLGVWAEHGLQATFALEYDTGSEHLPQLTAKLPGYGRLAKAMADLDQACPLLLFCFPTSRREQAARRALVACYDAPALRVATTAIDPEHTSPAGRCGCRCEPRTLPARWPCPRSTPRCRSVAGLPRCAGAGARRGHAGCPVGAVVGRPRRRRRRRHADLG